MISHFFCLNLLGFPLVSFCWEQTPSFNFSEISFHFHFGKIFTGYKILVWQYPERNCSIVSVMNIELVIRLSLLWGICQRTNSAFYLIFLLVFGYLISWLCVLIWAHFYLFCLRLPGFWVSGSTVLHQLEKILRFCSFRWYLWSIFSVLPWDIN